MQVAPEEIVVDGHQPIFDQQQLLIFKMGVGTFAFDAFGVEVSERMLMPVGHSARWALIVMRT